jgi:uncharacterized protein (TIGR03437 family)
MTAIPAGLLWGQAPSFTSSSFTNAATSQSISAVALGELITIFGTNLSSTTQFIPQGSPNPTQIPGSQTRVFFGNIPAPLLYVSPTLVNFQVPYDLPQALCTVDVTVRNENGSSAAVMIGVTLQDPGLFAILKGDNTILLPNEGRPGDVLNLLVNGLGDILPRLASGTPAPTSPIHNSVFAPQVAINGVRATLISSSLAPGLVGVYRVQVTVPAGVSAPLNVTVTKSPATTSCGR